MPEQASPTRGGRRRRLAAPQCASDDDAFALSSSYCWCPCSADCHGRRCIYVAASTVQAIAAACDGGRRERRSSLRILLGMIFSHGGSIRALTVSFQEALLRRVVGQLLGTPETPFAHVWYLFKCFDVWRRLGLSNTGVDFSGTCRVTAFLQAAVGSSLRLCFACWKKESTESKISNQLRKQSDFRSAASARVANSFCTKFANMSLKIVFQEFREACAGPGKEMMQRYRKAVQNNSSLSSLLFIDPEVLLRKTLNGWLMEIFSAKHSSICLGMTNSLSDQNVMHSNMAIINRCFWEWSLAHHVRQHGDIVARLDGSVIRLQKSRSSLGERTFGILYICSVQDLARLWFSMASQHFKTRLFQRVSQLTERSADFRSAVLSGKHVLLRRREQHVVLTAWLRVARRPRGRQRWIARAALARWLAAGAVLSVSHAFQTWRWAVARMARRFGAERREELADEASRAVERASRAEQRVDRVLRGAVALLERTVRRRLVAELWCVWRNSAVC
eukprot:TRINITY_DN3926_c0_g1_i2.p1 TRINITY_DN3926_c0_g1~~TRINITY_DN3926_c0_g1_i2.p1  ORF type:complete len:520 (-),score=57.32 TRINITY_DN3926_c0_g1_i2:73-1587(-)